MADHRVRPGGCFASIAKDNNFFNYLTLYDHADNAALKATRPNPNQLVEGDIVRVHKKRQKSVTIILDGTKGFVIDRRKTKLRLVVTDYHRTPLAPAACNLSVGPARSMAPPGAQGLLEIEIDPSLTSGTLRMTFRALPAFVALPPDPVAVNPPANPPDILPSQFRDRAPKEQIEALEVSWSLDIGSLEPKETIRGTLQRLNNLTYTVPIRTTENDRTRVPVKGYQALRRAGAKTGAVAAIRDELTVFHDAP